MDSVEGARSPTVTKAVEGLDSVDGGNLLIRLRYSETAYKEINAWVENNANRKTYAKQLGLKNCYVSLAQIAESDEFPKTSSAKHSMTIRTVDENGKPIVGAKVFQNHVLHTPNGERPTTIKNHDYSIDSKGEAIIEWTGESKDLRIWVSKPSFVPLHAMWAIDSQTDGDQLPSEFQFELETGTEIGGIVTNDKGQPVEGAKVEIENATATWYNLVRPNRPGIRPVPTTWLAHGDSAVVTDVRGQWTAKNIPSKLVFKEPDIQGTLRAPNGPPLRLRVSHPSFQAFDGTEFENRLENPSLEDLRKKTVNITLKGSFEPKQESQLQGIRPLQSKQELETKVDPIKSISILAVDALEQPIANAEVHLYQHSNGDNGRYHHFGPFISDNQGRVICQEALFTTELGTFDRWIYARVPGQLVGVARSTQWKGRDPINLEGRVQLQASQSIEGQVTVPLGFDPRDVKGRVQTMHAFSGPGDFDFQSFPRQHNFPGLDTALTEIFERSPDASGKVSFHDVPVSGRLYLQTIAKGLGESQWRNDDRTFDDPIELTLFQESQLLGQVLLLDGQPAKNLHVTARLTSDRPYLTTFRANTNEEGRLQINGLPQTDFMLSIIDATNSSTFRPREFILVEPGEKRDLNLTMEKGVFVSGRVLDESGEPIEGASLSSVTESSAGLSSDRTDSTGDYRLHLPAGIADIYFNGLQKDLSIQNLKSSNDCK